MHKRAKSPVRRKTFEYSDALPKSMTNTDCVAYYTNRLNRKDQEKMMHSHELLTIGEKFVKGGYIK